MTDPNPLLLLDQHAAAPLQKAAQRAYLCVLVGLASLLAVLLVLFAVLSCSEADAGRISASRGHGYLSVLVSAFAASHGRPKAL